MSVTSTNTFLLQLYNAVLKWASKDIVIGRSSSPSALIDDYVAARNRIIDLIESTEFNYSGDDDIAKNASLQNDTNSLSHYVHKGDVPRACVLIGRIAEKYYDGDFPVIK